MKPYFKRTINLEEMLSIIELVKQQATLFHPLYLSIISLILFAYFLAKWIAAPSAITDKRRPPSPPKLPVLGNLHQVGIYAHRSLESLSQRYGALMLLHFGSKPVLIVSSAEAAKEIMKTHDLVFAGRPKLKIIEKLLYNYKDVAGAPYGEYWRQMRSVCVLHLLNNKRVQSFRAAREEEAALLIKKISNSSSVPVNLSEMFSSLTNDLICRVAFGRKYSSAEEDGKKFHQLFAEFMRLLGSFNAGQFIPWLAWVNRVDGFDDRVHRTAKEFDKFLDGIVEEHIDSLQQKKINSGKEDFVHVLLDLQNNRADFSLDRESIKALILDMFAGGSDTSSTVLEWTMTELIRHPRVMKELQKEVKKIAEEKSERNEMITEADLDKMHYLKLVIKEGLRLHAPFPLLAGRETTQHVKVMGYEIDAGTMVLTNAWAIARDPRTWTKPEEFWPERFLNNSVDFRGQDFEFIPFGAGRRGCPGISFATPIIELALANLVNNFKWELPGGATGETLDITEAIGITARRKNPLIAVATPISASSL